MKIELQTTIFLRLNSFLKCLHLFILLQILIINPYSKEKLYVFYPSTVRPQIVKQKLSIECPELDITVFGRYRDFEAKIKSEPPDAVLTKPQVIQQVEGYSVLATGTKSGKSTESFVLLSIDSEVKPENLSETTIGTVDFLGRKGMKAFISENFSSPPRLKHVTKVEDLLPLLRFKMVRAILIPERNISFFKENSKLNFKVTKLPDVKPGIVALASKNKEAAGSLKAVINLNSNISSIFGVDKWK